MPNPFQPDITLARKALAWTLRCRGKTLRQIAEAVEREGLGHVEEMSVSYWLKEQRQKVASQLYDEALASQAEQLEFHRHALAEALDAWEKSKEADRLIREKESIEPDPLPVADGQPAAARFRRGRKETVHELRDQCGDPRYLESAMNAAAAIRKLLGLDATPNSNLTVRTVATDAEARQELRDLIETVARRRREGDLAPQPN